MGKKIRITVWNEYRHEKLHEKVRKVYPQGIHGALAAFLKTRDDFEVTTATLDEPEHGLTDKVLENTDVLIWWGHKFHHEVKDEIVEKVYQRIQEGMGLIPLHSGHASKIFRKLCGTQTRLRWRELENGEKERLWVVEPGHPIVEGLNDYIDIPHEEMYGERFEIPAPDELVFISWFQGGEVFRSGCCYNRGKGKIFYFRPGHESFPTFHQPEILKVIENAVRWAAPVNGPIPIVGHTPVPIEDLNIGVDNN